MIKKKHTVLHLVNQLSLVNYSISYLVINQAIFFDKNFNINSFILSNSIEKFFSKKKNIFKINFFFLIKQFRDIVSNNNVKYIHIHNIWSVNFLLVVFFYRKNLLYFIHPHGMLLKEALNNKSKLHYIKKIFFLKVIEIFLSRKNIIFLAVTNKERMSIYKYFKQNKVYLLGTFYIFKKRNIQFTKLKKNFICLSRINAHKRILDLIVSFYKANLTNKYKLFIYGEKEDYKYFSQCIDTIKKLSLEKKVFLKNAIYNKKKQNILLSSWANILISRSEVISLSVIESGYYYLPSLVNKNIAESLFAKNSIFISKFSTEAIASKIRKISSISLAERINRGKLINSLVVKNFSINNYAKNLLNIYNKNV